MTKYTVVYSECANPHFNSYVTLYDHVETDDLRSLLNDNYGCNVWFVFEGHCRPESSFSNNEVV